MLLAGLATTPLDVIKTRLMTQGASGRYKNFVDATIQVRPCHALHSFAHCFVILQSQQADGQGPGTGLGPGQGRGVVAGHSRHARAHARPLATRPLATQIARTEGATAFLAGWQPRLIWISMGGFVFFPVLVSARGPRCAA